MEWQLPLAETAPEYPRVAVFVDLGLAGTHPLSPVECEIRLRWERDSLTEPRHTDELDFDPRSVNPTTGVKRNDGHPIEPWTEECCHAVFPALRGMAQLEELPTPAVNFMHHQTERRRGFSATGIVLHMWGVLFAPRAPNDDRLVLPVPCCYLHHLTTYYTLGITRA